MKWKFLFNSLSWKRTSNPRSHKYFFHKINCCYIHTHTIIGHYNRSVRIIDLVSHTTYVVCVNFLYIIGGTYSLKSTPNDRFEKLFMAILFILRVFARNLLRGNRQRNIFRISFWCLAWDSNRGFSSNKSTHHLLDHGDLLKSIEIFNFLFF